MNTMKCEQQFSGMCEQAGIRFTKAWAFPSKHNELRIITEAMIIKMGFGLRDGKEEKPSLKEGGGQRAGSVDQAC